MALAVDLCLQDGQFLQAKELFLQAQAAAAEKLRRFAAVRSPLLRGRSAPAEMDPHLELDPSDADPEDPAENLPTPTDEAALQTDGMPTWLSPREGHLVALIVCHVPWLHARTLSVWM